MTNFKNDKITCYYFAECFFSYSHAVILLITLQQDNQCKLNKFDKNMPKKGDK